MTKTIINPNGERKPVIVVKLPPKTNMAEYDAIVKGTDKSAISKDYYFLFMPNNCDEYEVRIFFDKDITMEKLAEVQKEVFEMVSKDKHYGTDRT